MLFTKFNVVFMVIPALLVSLVALLFAMSLGAGIAVWTTHPTDGTSHASAHLWVELIFMLSHIVLSVLCIALVIKHSHKICSIAKLGDKMCDPDMISRRLTFILMSTVGVSLSVVVRVVIDASVAKPDSEGTWVGYSKHLLRAFKALLPHTCVGMLMLIISFIWFNTQIILVAKRAAASATS